MKINFKFLDTEKWSMFGTINTLIPFGLTLLLQPQNVNLRNMVFSSLICMMDGDLLPKVLFVGFLLFQLEPSKIFYGRLWGLLFRNHLCCFIFSGCY